MAASIPKSPSIGSLAVLQGVGPGFRAVSPHKPHILENQSLLVIPPECRARDAVSMMRKHGYSQVPVVDDGEVQGVFSFRSFAQGAAAATLEEWTKQKCAPGDLCVEEFLEQFEFARVTEEMSRVFRCNGPGQLRPRRNTGASSGHSDADGFP